MKRVALGLSYDGSNYHGWQIQNNAVTVQGELQKALSQLFKTEVSVSGCSRTDAGVHAKRFVCHFDLPFPFPLDRLPLALNALLPFDIAVKEAFDVPDDFHARFSCRGKTYVYRLWNAPLRSPFESRRAGFWPVSLDAERMNVLAKDFVGEHDFSSFMATGSVVEDTVRKISSFSVDREDNLIFFSVTGNGFLYNMVRIMVGTLIYADLGKLEKSIPEILQLKDRTHAGITVPPQGLYLEKVYFDLPRISD
ncbi:MAG: tRNA pseudouridine(38-40) synthase TruA [Clostridia bacterium]|nr:tRNA pseudouridine(38-40) synthase TruA [Clostridia bacterium]